MTRDEMLKLVVYGIPYPTDILYRLTKENQTEYATMYNNEITRFSQGLKDILRYGDNAYYWLATPSHFTEIGWSGEQIL